MRHPGRRSRSVGVVLSIAAASALVAWAVAQSSATLAPVATFAGIAGVVTLAAALAGGRSRTISTGLVLVGAAVVAGTLHEAAGTRAAALALSGAIMFCVAEVADRSLDQARGMERRRGARHWDPAWVIGVAAVAAAASYAAASIRGFVAGGGPAALAAGTVAAVLVAVLARGALQARARP